MRFIPTPVAGVIVVEPDVYRDARGFFLETFHAGKYREGGISATFVQDNQSRSVGRTIRGLHLQLRNPQGKLIRVIEGEIFDVAVDLRRGSATFGQWTGVTLSASNFKQCYVPSGFAHGFAVTSEFAQVEYKCTSFYDRDDEVGVAWDDPSLAITWPVTDPILSDRDRQHPTLKEMAAQLPAYD